jgi:hypothetical protein
LAAEAPVISAEQLAKLTGFDVVELSRLARKGYFPSAKNAAYEQNKVIPGCFKAYQDRLKEAGGLPTYQSMAECSTQTGIPKTVLKAARKESAESFRAHRILLGPLLKWLFSKNGDDKDWGDLLKKFQALREEIRYERDKDQAVTKDEVSFALNKVMALLFATLDRRADQLPSVLHGMDAAGIKNGLVESNEILKGELRDEFESLFKRKKVNDSD